MQSLQSVILHFLRSSWLNSQNSSLCNRRANSLFRAVFLAYRGAIRTDTGMHYAPQQALEG